MVVKGKKEAAAIVANMEQYADRGSEGKCFSFRYGYKGQFIIIITVNNSKYLITMANGDNEIKGKSCTEEEWVNLL